jgi:succinate dehydrogenase hydrophobic anchor subunit
MLRDNGLLIVNVALFVVFLVAMSLAGVREYNADQIEHQQAAVSFWHYLTTGAFVEAVFENWESEFLQMGSYVVLTAYLFQRGSSESKPIDQETPQDADPRDADLRKRVPWPVRKGGVVLRLYENSLALFFFLLFFLSVWLHAVGGAKTYSEEQVTHGESAVSTGQYLLTSRFWFESFQNWQSEFLAVACIVGASVYLRQRGSPESKPVAEPHLSTGT